MGRELTHDEARELLGAYALGAVDEDERAEVERHLLEDPEMRSELHALQLGAAWLDRSAERPAPSVWAGIASKLDDEAYGTDEVGTSAPLEEDELDATTRAGVRWGTGRPAAVPRPARPRRSRAVLAIAAMIAAVAVVAGGVRALTPDEPTVDEAAVVAAAASTPGVETLDLTGTDGTVGMAMLADGSGLVTHSTLPGLRDDETYQLWAITDDGPQSIAVLGAEPGPHAVTVPPSASSLAVTTEPRGGSPEPTGDTVASAPLVAA